MKKKLILVSLVCLLLPAAFQAQTQSSAPPGPPKVLQIFREEVKPGKQVTHEKIEAGWPRAFAKANWPIHYFAMTTVSGPNEAWFITGYDSFAALEKDRHDIDKSATLKAELDQLSSQDGELLAGTRSIIATYREDLSYRTSINLPQMRYVSLTTVRVRPGHTEDYVTRRKMAIAALEKANINFPSVVYQISSGAPSGTYLTFRPLKSLAEMDGTGGTAFRDAMGAENMKKYQQLESEAILFTETILYSFSPKMSYVGKEFASADPDFWTPKPKALAKAAADAGSEKIKPTAKP